MLPTAGHAMDLHDLDPFHQVGELLFGKDYVARQAVEPVPYDASEPGYDYPDYAMSNSKGEAAEFWRILADGTGKPHVTVYDCRGSYSIYDSGAWDRQAEYWRRFRIHVQRINGTIIVTNRCGGMTSNFTADSIGIAGLNAHMNRTWWHLDA